MTCIKELFPRPNINLSEKIMRPLVYGFECQVFKKDKYIDVTFFLDPDCYSMFNIFRLDNGELLARHSFYEIKNVAQVSI